MSRQFDESIQGKFDYNGEWYSLVEEINTTEDLLEAIHIKDLLLQCVNHFEPDSGHPCFWMLPQQEECIDEYLEKFRDFDKTILNSNIAFLLKKNDMRMGDLEQILKISSGYISRTSKPGSDKKLSIDIVWKIARIFSINLIDLLETDLTIPTSNTTLVSKFLMKLCDQTRENSIDWESHGGVVAELKEIYSKLGLVTEGSDPQAVYHPQHLNSEYRWILSDDIYVYKNIDAGRDLAIIPYTTNNERYQGYDFIFIGSEGEDFYWEKAFYTSEDYTGTLKKQASRLYKSIKEMELDAKVAPRTRNLINKYLNGGFE
jgi:hypothetical protein